MAKRNQTRRITHDRRDKIEQQRKQSKQSRLRRELAETIFSTRYIAYVMNNPEGLLRMPYLIREIKATKRILKALKKRLYDPRCKALYEKINMLDGGGTPTSPLCAIARHLMARAMHLDLESLFFDGCIGEWTMETIVHGVTPTMGGLPSLISDARTSFQTIQREMTSAKAGYVEVGAFEPDLRSIDEFRDRAALQRLCEEQGWDFPEGGGFVLCSHRLVRVQSDKLYQSLLDAEFPGYRRTLRMQMDKNKTYQENMDDILAYIWKLEELVNGADGDVDINDGDCRRCIRVAALGTTTEGLIGAKREDALCEFAIFFDNYGLDFFKINHVNVYARAWYGKEERSAMEQEGIELQDAVGTQEVLHRHCNDAPRRTLFQETYAYSKMTSQEKVGLMFAQRDMETLKTSREVGPLIKTGGKMDFGDDLMGFSSPIIKHGARHEHRKKLRDARPNPKTKRRLPAWEIEILQSLKK